MEVHTRGVQGAGGEGEIFPADLDHLFVDLHEVDAPDTVIAAEFPDGAAVPAPDDQHVLHMRMHRHGDVDDHLMVDELVLFREHHKAVQRQAAAELLGLKHSMR